MNRLFLEADEIGQWQRPHSVHERWSDHGAGLLLTLANQRGYPMESMTLKAMHSWAEFRMAIKGVNVLAMNVRSWRYIYAKRAAEIFKSVNPNGQVWVGGMHATVALQEMIAVPEFDVIVSGAGEGTWLELLENGGSSERILQGHCRGFENLDNHPWIDRTLWPRTLGNDWPLEGYGDAWNPNGQSRAATMITATSCPFHCSFCAPAERNHFGPTRRRSVGNVIGELNMIDERWGPFSTVVFHEGEFLMNRPWLEEWHERYPRETKNWHMWASCRADMILRWKPLVEALVRDCNWHCLSIGLESNSQSVLNIMNKGTTPAQNDAAIEFINELGDKLVAEGKRPPVIFANVMLAIPGETPEDAFETVRMLGRIKRCLPSISWFTAYPGSTLGDRMIAEGRSLDVHKRYLRFPNEAKILGIDYQFYVDLFNGRYDAETGVNMRALLRRQGSAEGALI